MSRRLTTLGKADPQVPGFLVDNIGDIGKKVAAAIRKQLGLKFAQYVEIQTSRGLSLHIATTPPITRDDDGRFPVLQIREPSERDGVYLETALDHEWLQGCCYLTHVSLKLFFGPAPRTSGLKFRAEWDPRIEAKVHAQPHWNIEAQIEQPTVQENFDDRAPWVPVPTVAPWIQAVPQSDSPPVSEIDLSHFHFAMSANWQHPQSHHSGSIDDAEALVRWISGCVAYIREQLHSKRMM